MSNTSDEIKLQSKQNIICHVAKVKSAMSTHYLADLRGILCKNQTNREMKNSDPHSNLHGSRSP